MKIPISGKDEVRNEPDLKFEKEYFFGGYEKDPPNIETLDAPEIDNEVAEWFKRKLLEAAQIESKMIDDKKKSFWERLKFWKWKE